MSFTFARGSLSRVYHKFNENRKKEVLFCFYKQANAAYFDNAQLVKDIWESYTYNIGGNPLAYRGMTMAWEGRQMAALTGTGLNASYTYDADGIRTTKTVNGEDSEYYYGDGLLYFEKRGNSLFYYTYDTYGNLAGINYYPNGTNAQT